MPQILRGPLHKQRHRAAATCHRRIWGDERKSCCRTLDTILRKPKEFKARSRVGLQRAVHNVSTRPGEARLENRAVLSPGHRVNHSRRRQTFQYQLQNRVRHSRQRNGARRTISQNHSDKSRCDGRTLSDRQFAQIMNLSLAQMEMGSGSATASAARWKESQSRIQTVAFGLFDFGRLYGEQVSELRSTSFQHGL